MPSIYQLKSRFQDLLRPLLRGLVAVGVTANHVTVGAMLASVAYGGWLACQPGQPLPWLLLPLFLFLRMALNAIDGMLAREHGQKSRLGGILNEVGDVVSDAALYLPFALLLAQPAWAVLAVALALLTEFVGVLGPSLGATRRYDGPMGKSDRAFAYGAYGLLLGLWPQAAAWGGWVFGLSAALMALTCVNRARAILKEGEHV
ncbi:phosphatidylglycerophosphate synthase [Chromobacterium alkanivorans]|uniref:CDP-alcohol phosphatidyltransferase family protein n=1 Tax=Chromobacterium alkanivorans TaxID=1071719 RepID=UPI002169B560|nr:CDP-alcohol phosphatidyltransferase family protein [Chromobacterium alkanivorans]MCS3806119.1 phosphatidylglycerophosphate synthase [Chromobacterium alkanivorans]MCS3820479.1 phosphatidylglycerophosphate synthase [Chromobacterium alkanivorans]MCS3875237.1 phosphatidylglycerophosphate synthase [Chromobacterium alkanivorans]